LRLMLILRIFRLIRFMRLMRILRLMRRLSLPAFIRTPQSFYAKSTAYKYLVILSNL
jgi:hypothetical protein